MTHKSLFLVNPPPTVSSKNRREVMIEKLPTSKVLEGANTTTRRREDSFPFPFVRGQEQSRQRERESESGRVSCSALTDERTGLPPLQCACIMISFFVTRMHS